MNPDEEMPGKGKDRIRVHKLLANERKLQVIYKMKKNGREFIIITASWRD